MCAKGEEGEKRAEGGENEGTITMIGKNESIFKGKLKITPQAMRSRMRGKIMSRNGQEGTMNRMKFKKNPGAENKEKQELSQQKHQKSLEEPEEVSAKSLKATQTIEKTNEGWSKNRKNSSKISLESVCKKSRKVKEFLFSFAYFDIQFIALNELLHSDASKIDKLVSRPTLSYFLSFLCLLLLNVDLWLILGRFSKLLAKIKSKSELTMIEEEDKDNYLEDIKDSPELSKAALSFNLASMIRFSVYQLLVASTQLSPNFQTGLLMTLQLVFFIFYALRQVRESMFSNIFIMIKNLVFEFCILVFLLLSFIFSFENSHSWFSAGNLAWLQILAASLLFLSVFVELVTLIVKSILNTVENVKSQFCKPSKKVGAKGLEGHSEGKEGFKNGEKQLSKYLDGPRGGVEVVDRRRGYDNDEGFLNGGFDSGRAPEMSPGGKAKQVFFDQ